VKSVLKIFFHREYSRAVINNVHKRIKHKPASKLFEDLLLGNNPAGALGYGALNSLRNK
jgi:hypothetical protein